MTDGLYLGLNLGVDPTAALVSKGRLLAYAEEERHSRVKHARNAYPIDAIRCCLEQAGASLSDITELVVNWDLEAASDGSIARFFEAYNATWPVDSATQAWQAANLGSRQLEAARTFHHNKLRREFADERLPPVRGLPHHFTHAFHSFSQSKFDEALCLTIDGSGDTEATVLWRCDRDGIAEIYRREMPHSLGWFYAAITEYLGFEAYDGEYKVMGLAPYGIPDRDIAQKLRAIVTPDPDGIGYQVQGRYLHWGTHSFSTRFTDALPELLGRAPRTRSGDLDDWHMSLAYEAQRLLEQTVCHLVRWAVAATGLRKVCVGGGVGLNVKMNQALFEMAEVEDVFCNPLCSDNGAAAGSAFLACHRAEGHWPEQVRNLGLGAGDDPDLVEENLLRVGVRYEKLDDAPRAAAEALAAGRIIAWVQGRTEAGPRALGCRSILADPRTIAARDQVNAAIKYRELWRPFCPSILAEEMPRYFERHTDAPYMVLAFKAKPALRAEAPAIVHSDGTARVQSVDRADAPRFHALIENFGRLTGVPVVLNTSFNLKGEPIVNSTLDALRTFFSSGLDELYLGDFVVRKASQTQRTQETQHRKPEFAA